MKNKLLFFLMPLALTTLVCGFYNLDTDYFTKQEPLHADLAGVYEPTASTLTFIQEKLGYVPADISISLMPDSSLQLSNVPDWWRYIGGNSAGNLVSGQGEWQVVPDQEWWSIQLNYASLSDTDFEGSVSVPLAGDKPPYQLWFYIGDPDEGDVMIFEQVIETPLEEGSP